MWLSGRILICVFVGPVDWRSNGSVHGVLLPTACTAAQMNAADGLLVGTYFRRHVGLVGGYMYVVCKHGSRIVCKQCETCEHYLTCWDATNCSCPVTSDIRSVLIASGLKTTVYGSPQLACMYRIT